jgi:fucose 4-O-acetylase-like acetyltransferase
VPPVPQAKPSRVHWIDAAKGLGILLVVFGHDVRGLASGGIIGADTAWEALDRAIYAFHMPLFFFLVGLFLERSARKGAVQFVSGRALRLLWPLALWTWIFFLFKACAGAFANTPTQWSEFPLLPLPPQLHFWFLWALFLSSLVCLPLALAAARKRKPQHLLWGALVVSTGAACLLREFCAFNQWFTLAIMHLPFIILGMLSVHWSAVRLTDGRALVAFVLFVGVLVSAAIFGKPSVIHFYGYAFIATYALCYLFQYGEARGLQYRILVLLGGASMAIYLAHTIFSASTRIVLLQMDVTSTLVHVSLGTAIGVIVPFGLFLAVKGRRAQAILGW